MIHESIQIENFLIQTKSQIQSTLRLILQKYKQQLARYQTHPLFNSSSCLFPFMQKFDDIKTQTDTINWDDVEVIRNSTKDINWDEVGHMQTDVTSIKSVTDDVPASI